jgi:hypothetical protein
MVLVTVEEAAFFAKNGLFLGAVLGGNLAAVRVITCLEKYKRQWF